MVLKKSTYLLIKNNKLGLSRVGAGGDLSQLSWIFHSKSSDKSNTLTPTVRAFRSAAFEIYTDVYLWNTRNLIEIFASLARVSAGVAIF